jgi:hypothetical protein
VIECFSLQADIKPIKIAEAKAALSGEDPMDLAQSLMDTSKNH